MHSIPYEGSNRSPIDRDGLIAEPQADHFKTLGIASDQDMEQAKTYDSVSNFLKERFETDLENEQYEIIDVPDFRGGRQSRFIHDFNNNLTGIIDGHCCFVMPLNRNKRIVPPRNIFTDLDLHTTMYNGHDDVDTKVARETMRAIFPPIQDKSTVGDYIGQECKEKPIYRLKKVNKRAYTPRPIIAELVDWFDDSNGYMTFKLGLGTKFGSDFSHGFRRITD